MELKQIGTVRSADGEFVLQVDEPYRAALAELDGFGYVNVLFWCHYLDQPDYRQVVTCPQPYKDAPETVGIFATRSPVRPNPIAVSPSKLLGVDEAAGVVRLAYIDAEDGSPLLDIKPYHPAVDRVRDAPVPAWCAHWPQWLEDSAEFDWSAEFVHAQ
jgi:tRNA-Thr(GGU) m(6)t(6)A37 methyltransferase TsaA